MTRPWIALALALLAAPAVSRAAECPDSDEITTQEAPACVGKVRRVVGKVDNVGKGKSGVTFINFCKNFRGCPFVAVVFGKRAAAFPDLDKLKGETIEVSGQVATYNDQSQIVLEDPSQLIVRGSTLVRPPRAPERPSEAPSRPAPPREKVDWNDDPRPAEVIERRVAPKPVERTPEPLEEEEPVVERVAPKPVERPVERPAEDRRKSRVWPDEGPVVKVETIDPAMPERPAKPVVLPRPVEPVKPVLKVSRPPVEEKPSTAPEPMRAPVPSIGALDAAKYVGKRVRVKGKVTQVTFEGDDLVARMAKGPASVLFAAVIPGEKVDRFATVVESWDGAVVEVEGEVVLYSGVPAIFIRSEAQVLSK